MAKEETLGALIDELDKARETHRALSAEANEAKADYNALEEKIKSKLMESNIDKAAGRRASVTPTCSVVGTIKDYDTMVKFIKRTGYFHLLNRAVNNASFRELYEQAVTKGQSAEKFIAQTGLAPFERITLNHSSLK
jgi:L-serine deaminase